MVWSPVKKTGAPKVGELMLRKKQKK